MTPGRPDPRLAYANRFEALGVAVAQSVIQMLSVEPWLADLPEVRSAIETMVSRYRRRFHAIGDTRMPRLDDAEKRRAWIFLSNAPTSIAAPSCHDLVDTAVAAIARHDRGPGGPRAFKHCVARLAHLARLSRRLPTTPTSTKENS